jgi:hypothetical protein
MSEISSAPTPAPVKKSGSFQSLVFSVIAFVAIAIGLSSAWRGVRSLMGWDGSAEFQALLVESDAAFKAAMDQLAIAEPLASSLLDAVKAQPLPDARLEQGDNAKQAISAFQESAKQFALAGKKIDEALALGLQLQEERHAQSLKLRSQACTKLSELSQLNADFCNTMVDESITTAEELAPKLAELTAKREAVQKEAETAMAESQNLAKPNVSE